MAEIVGIDDPEVLQTLAVMEFTPNTARLIFLLPLVQMAWADGRVTRRQRKFIFEAARLHAIDEHGAGGRMLSEWVKRRPSDSFFELALRVIRNILHSLSPEAHESRKRELLEHCRRVAKGSRSSFIRERKATLRERRLVEHFATKLERHVAFSRKDEKKKVCSKK
jgi:hypothetical protein